MVEDIIKAVNHKYIYVSKNRFDEFKWNCKEKLLACSSRNRNKFEAFFDCCSLNEEELLELLQICESVNTVFLGFLLEKSSEHISIYNKKIFSGEKIIFTENTMILQDIPKDCYIESNNNLIILGNVKGCIDLIYKDCTIIASSFSNARIRIFDSKYQNMTFFSCTSLYYENSQIVKEENTWDVVLASPLVKEE